MCSITQSPWKRNRCKVCEQYIKELNGEIIPPITWIAIKSWRAHVMCTNGNEEEQAPSIIISVMTVTPMVSKSVLCRIGSQATYLVEFLIVMEVGQ